MTTDSKPLPRAKYSPEFIQRVADQTAPRSITVAGNAYTAMTVIDALVSTATPTKLIDRIIGVEDGNTEAWLVGGATDLNSEDLADMFLALYHIKTNKLEHLKGQDKELVIRMTYGLLTFSSRV